MCRAVAALVADQKAAVEPDYQTPFEDAHDAVRRLLPYHIFQLPLEDGKGKGRASEADLAREELAGMLKLEIDIMGHSNKCDLYRNTICITMS